MKKLIGLLLWLLLVLSLGTCNFLNETSQAPVVNQSTEAAFISFTSSSATISSTFDLLTPTATAQFFNTLEAKTSTSESFPNYRDCSGNMFFMSIRGWGLCHGLQDPITVISQSNQVRQFSYSAYYGTEVPHVCTRLLHLTDDESYLYFSLDAECELIEPGFVSSIGVFRMKLLNGEVSEILRASYDFDSYTGYYYTVSVSPTGKYLVYIFDNNQPLTLDLLDLETGEHRLFSLGEKFLNGGHFTWSDDGTKIVFWLESEKDFDHLISMTFLDLMKDEPMTIFIKDKEYRWLASTIEVTVNGVKVTPIDSEPLFYDIETGILSPADK